ncbi:glycosyltransferase N-terminal domain-containing protein [Flavicella sp.]|uniref:3-deoxy-D-manno-octulosonic acid transferase n=1 Tax=Flavicella sp. TaxID=2957742 RepID=UPI0030199ABA
MQILYDIAVFLVGGLLKIMALFSPKLKLFVSGRKEVFPKLKGIIADSDTVFWLHCASLGEFEQARPIIEKLRNQYNNCKIVLTFFSPSGYEVQKNYKLADVVVYLPLDSTSNAKKFLELAQPSVAVFVKYEFWPNLLSELKNTNIPTILVSGIFRQDQIFFKSHGGWMRSKLKAFSHFFLQDENSSGLLNSIGFENTTVCGDTRFDRVYDILDRENKLDFIEEFVGDSYVFVAGSTWPEDEDLLVNYILENSKKNEKIIIAPHNIKSEAIANLKAAFGDTAVLFSEKQGKHLKSFKVFIIDTIGVLTKIYSVADVAYVGGGYTKSGIHNVLEPATFGIPVVIGPNFKKFKEAVDLVAIGGCISTSNQLSVNKILVEFRDNEDVRKEKGQIALSYIKDSLGASDTILRYVKSLE